VSVLLYLVGYFVVAIVLSIVLAVAGGILVGMGALELPPIDFGTTALGVEEIVQLLSPYLLPVVILTALYSIAYTWAFVHLIDRRSLRSFGLATRRGWRSDFAKGVALAAIILAVVFVVSLATGSIRIEGFARPAPPTTNVLAYFAGAVLAFMLVGFYEELMFRGYVLQKLNERAGKVTSVVVSSIVFALMHGVNPGADVVGIVNTTIIAIILCALFFRTGSLWMPIGFHFAWNFLLGYVYSLPVSGLPIHGILDVVEVEPASRISGGTYGPEASILTSIALGAWAAWLIWRRTGPRSENQA
jgi:membrane protease YdiL (CAAX protease family)